MPYNAFSSLAQRRWECTSYLTLDPARLRLEGQGTSDDKWFWQSWHEQMDLQQHMANSKRLKYQNSKTNSCRANYPKNWNEQQIIFILQCGMPAPLRKEVLLVRQLHRMNVSKGSIMSKHLCIDSADHVLLVQATQMKVQYSSVPRCRNTHGYKLIGVDRAFVLLTNLFGNMKETHWELSSKNLNHFDLPSKCQTLKH